MLKTYHCDWCGKEFERLECQTSGKRHIFCSRQCHADYSSKAKNPDGYADFRDFSKASANFSNLAKKLNPTRMTPEIREKLRHSRLGKGSCKGYSKIYGRAAHRVVAEQMLGRPLGENEVVHHRDGNRYNNSPDNLMVFKSQADHAKFHAELNWFLREIKKMDSFEGGDAQ